MLAMHVLLCVNQHEIDNFFLDMLNDYLINYGFGAYL